MSSDARINVSSVILIYVHIEEMLMLSRAAHCTEQTGLVDFVLKVVNERHFADDEIFAAIETAENEMLQQGIVAVGDICNNELTIPQKNKGRLQYHNFIEASGFPPSVAEQRFKRAADFYKSYSDNFSANSIVPHAPYSVSPEMFGMINDFPGNYSQYREWLKDQEQLPVSSFKSPVDNGRSGETGNQQPVTGNNKKPSFKDKREFDLLEKEIADLTKEKEMITGKLNNSKTPFEELQQLSLRIGELTKSLDEKEIRWLELSEVV